MSTPELSETEAATVARFEAASDAEESLRERIATAIAKSDGLGRDEWPGVYEERADAVLAVIRGES